MPLPTVFTDGNTLFASKLNQFITYLKAELKVPAGISAGRPSGLGPADIGRSYFDTTLGLWQLWDGTKWVGTQSQVTIYLPAAGAYREGDNLRDSHNNSDPQFRVWRFNNSGNQTLDWDVFIPSNASAAGRMVVQFYWYAEAARSTALSFRLKLLYQETPLGSGSREDRSSLWTEVSQTVVTPMRNINLNVTTFTITTNLMTPGRLGIIRLQRDTDHAGDTANSDIVYRFGALVITQ